MTASIRPYDPTADYQRIYDFLVEVYEPGDVFANWLAPRWEYMHYHPFIESVPVRRIGVLGEEDGIVAVAHPEDGETFTYMQVRPGRNDVKPELVDWVLTHFGGRAKAFGEEGVGIWINDFDTALQEAAAGRGFRRSGHAEEHSILRLDREIPETRLPDGFRLQSLDEGNDLAQVNRVQWRGFNHEGPPPEEGVAERAFMQSAPNFDPTLNVVAVGPDGSYVAYAGMWHVPDNRVAYVEPVATDPDFRRMGLGRAAALETVRRVQARGAELAWVGSNQEFYRALGFRKQFESPLWWRPA